MFHRSSLRASLVLASSLAAGAAALLYTTDAEASTCNWNVSGTISVDHEQSDMRDTFGTSALKNIRVRVSAQEKLGLVWGTWNSWPTVRTDDSGRFALSQSKNCNERRFRVEVMFDDDSLKVRADVSRWYTVHQDASGRRTGPSIRATFGTGTRALDLSDFNARRHADLWATTKIAFDHLPAGLGFREGFTIKYPSNTVAGDDLEASYSNPIDHVLHIFRARDGSDDHFESLALFHEMMHIWAYQYSTGELVLSNYLLAHWTTHGTVLDPAVAFHEGFAEFGADELDSRIFGTNRRSARSRNVFAGYSFDEYGRTDRAWEDVFIKLTLPAIENYDFGAFIPGALPGGCTSTSTACALPATTLRCDAPRVTFEDVLRTFKGGEHTSYPNDITAAEMNLDDYLTRAAWILPGFKTSQVAPFTRLVDPTGTAQPRSEFCSP